MTKKPLVYKLAVLGDGGVGKTALISRLRFKKFVKEVSGKPASSIGSFTVRFNVCKV